MSALAFTAIGVVGVVAAVWLFLAIDKAHAKAKWTNHYDFFPPGVLLIASGLAALIGVTQWLE